LGRTIHPLAERKEFVSLSRLVSELEQVRDVPADYATFSGMGEPTLANNLGQAIEVVKAALPLPVAVLTNSSLMSKEDVRRELALADVVMAKLDAPNKDLFRIINRPIARYYLDEMLQGIRRFRWEYRGKLALQMMFVEANKDHVPEMAKIAAELSPDEVQINTPLRPCNVAPLSPKEVATIRQEFAGLRAVVTVYEAPRHEVAPLSLEETLRRRAKEQSQQEETGYGDSHSNTE
jgi:wyosine [tRNA(Phe)-imidazoG37] synthetase (radical SAM superfamily)